MKKLLFLLLSTLCYNVFAEVRVTDTLSYQYQLIKISSKPIYTSEGDTIISNFELKYPEFVASNWTRTAKNIIFHTETIDQRSTSIDQFMTKFISASEEDNSNNDFPRMWDRNLTLIVKKQIAGTQCISFELNDVGYTGGAHGYATTRYFNFDRNSGMRLDLTHIVSKENLNKLNIYAEGIFRKQEKLSPKEPLNNYFFENNKFSLNSNFLIQKTGLLFFFNQYEIRSYAEGPMELFIPYSAIKNLIKPNPYIPKIIP